MKNFLLSLLILFNGVAYGDLSPLSVSATAIQGFAISAATPTDGDCLAYNSISDEWEPSSSCGGGGGGGTVTSVALSVPSFLSVAGSPVTTSGTLAVSYSGTPLPIANGGTNATTASQGFDNLSPMTALGDIIYGGVSGTGTRLPAGSNGEVLTLAGGVPVWQTAGAISSILVADSTPAAPAIASQSDSDTGFLLGNNCGPGVLCVVNDAVISLVISETVWEPHTDGTTQMGTMINSLLSTGSYTYFVKGGGSAAAPSFSFFSDTDTGIYQPSAGVLGFSTDGSRRAFFAPTGEFTVDNNLAISGRNAANSASIPLVKVNASDVVIVGDDTQATALEVYGSDVSVNGDTSASVGAEGPVQISSNSDNTTVVSQAQDTHIQAAAGNVFLEANGFRFLQTGDTTTAGHVWTASGTAGQGYWAAKSSPQGTICGWYDVGTTTLVSTCLGSNPSVSCPSGYTQRTTAIVDFCEAN